MKVVVFNGSPKGDRSITLKYVLYLQNKFPDIIFKIFHIVSVENKNENEIRKDILENLLFEIEKSDIVLWAFPVYIFHVPSQLLHFIEIVRKQKISDVFSGKYAAIISTSIHISGTLAINYIHAVCDDWNMKFTGTFNCETNDLLKSVYREKLIFFFNSILNTIEKKYELAFEFAPVKKHEFIYQKGHKVISIDTLQKKILIITDSTDKESNQHFMTEYFSDQFTVRPEIINLNEIYFKGGCLGCLKCGYDNHCVYQSADEFTDFYKAKVLMADIIIVSGDIKFRYLSHVWKLFFDRSYFFNHTQPLAGKQVGMILTGEVSHIVGLKEMLSNYYLIQDANIVGLVTDESKNSETISRLLGSLADRIIYAAVHNVLNTLPSEVIAMKYILEDALKNRFGFINYSAYRYYNKNHKFQKTTQMYGKLVINKILILLIRFQTIRNFIHPYFVSSILKKFNKLLENS